MYAPPAARATAMVALPDGAAALTLFSRLVGRAGDRLTAFEFMTRSCLDLVQSHLPGVTVPFAELPPAIVLAELSDADAAAVVGELLESVLAEVLGAGESGRAVGGARSGSYRGILGAAQCVKKTK